MTDFNVEVMSVPGRLDRSFVMERQRQFFESCVHEDPTHRGPLATMIDCLTHALESGRRFCDELDWVVVLQDDADPFHGVIENLCSALAFSPEPILGLSSYGDTTRKAVQKEVPYLVQPYALSGGAFAIRGDILEDLVKFLTPLWTSDGYLHDDSAICAFARWTGVKTARVSWALFDQQLRTTLKTSQAKRKPPVYTIEENQGVDWSAGFISNSDRTLSPTLRLFMFHVYERQSKLVPTELSREDWR